MPVFGKDHAPNNKLEQSRVRSQIDDDIAVGLRAADQYVAVRWRIDRIGTVADRSGHKSGLTGVADPRSARPPHRYVAGFGQLEQVLEPRPPAGMEAAADECDQRSRAGSPRRQMRRPARRSSDARGIGRTCAEDFGVDADWGGAPGCKAGGQIAHEGGWSTDVEVAIPRHAELPQHAHVQASGSVEIHPWPIPGIGRAVANVAAPVDQSFEEGARLLGKRMLATVAGAVDPPDLPRRHLRRQRVEHREHGGSPYARAQQNDGCLAGLKREAAPCRARVHHVADLQLLVDVGAGRAVVLPLDAQAISLGAGFARQRVAAHQRRRTGRRPQPHRHELTGERRGERLSVRRLEHQRDHAAAFAHLARYPQRPEPRPRRGRAGPRSEPDVSCRRAATALLREQRLEGAAPAGAQGRHAQRALQLAARVAGLVQQRIDLEYAHALGARGDPNDLVAGRHFAFLQHTEIETRSAVRDQQRGHPRLVHADAHPITGDARLGNLEQSPADPVTVADAHLPVGPAVDREVLAELPMGEVVSTELALPIVIGVDLIDEDSALLAAVPGQVPLPIAVYVEPPYHAAALNRRLPNGGVDGPAPPRDVARQAHVDGKQAWHHFSPRRHCRSSRNWAPATRYRANAAFGFRPRYSATRLCAALLR